jgi:hypothetical protein
MIDDIGQPSFNRKVPQLLAHMDVLLTIWKL